jgi:DNA-binding GntR family transcriptional regulator
MASPSPKPPAARRLVLDVANSSGLDDWAPDLQKTKVYERILLDLILGELKAGSRLDEQSLAARYDTGLAGVRDALGRLALEGLVMRRARSGTTVAPLDLVELRQGLEARVLIEPHCAALAARNASKAEAQAMLDIFADGEEAARTCDLPALVAMDLRFHAAVARASGNLALARILIPLQHKAARFWVFSFNGASERELIDEIEEHREVARVIGGGDVEASRQAMLRILDVQPEAQGRA